MKVHEKKLINNPHDRLLIRYISIDINPIVHSEHYNSCGKNLHSIFSKYLPFDSILLYASIHLAKLRVKTHVT
jgi:hypothetical protein